MQLSAADQAAMIAAFGEPVVIDGNDATADYRFATQAIEMFESGVNSSDIVILITDADKIALGVDYGIAVTARSTDYTVAEMKQKRSGLWLLLLTKA